MDALWSQPGRVCVDVRGDRVRVLRRRDDSSGDEGGSSSDDEAFFARVLQREAIKRMNAEEKKLRVHFRSEVLRELLARTARLN
jgi:hypothetical protein